MTPQLHTITSTTFIVSRHYVSVAQIPEIGGSALPKIEGDIPQLGLTITGPPVFFYFDFNPQTDGNRLEVGFPVASKLDALENLPAHYILRQSDPFFCLTADYIGGMPGINEAWHELFKAAELEGYAVGVEQREVYKHWVGFESPENITELQLQILKPPFTE